MNRSKKFKSFLESIEKVDKPVVNAIKKAHDVCFEATEAKKIDWSKYPNPVIQNGLEIMRIINKLGYEALAVGGLVRDILIGKNNPHDFDIATNMPMELAFKVFSKAPYKITKGSGKQTEEKREGTDLQTAKIYYQGEAFDLAHYRSEVGTSDHRRPDMVNLVNTFEEDSARRDLTVNAMGAHADGTIVDFWGGAKDIENKVIRTVGNPDERFEEDYLRMIRAIRFAGRLDSTIDKDTWNAILKLKDNLVHSKYPVPVERIKMEFDSTIGYGAKSFVSFLKTLKEAGIFELVLPGIDLSEDKINAMLTANSDDPLINYAILFRKVPSETLASTLDLSGAERDTISYVNNNMKLYHMLEKLDKRKALTLMFGDHKDDEAKHKRNFKTMREVHKAFNGGEDIPYADKIIDNIVSFKKIESRKKEITSALVDNNVTPNIRGTIVKNVYSWLLNEYSAGNEPSKEELVNKVVETAKKLNE